MTSDTGQPSEPDAKTTEGMIANETEWSSTIHLSTTPARNRTRRTWCCAASRPMPGARKPVGDPPADHSR